MQYFITVPAAAMVPEVQPRCCQCVFTSNAERLARQNVKTGGISEVGTVLNKFRILCHTCAGLGAMFACESCTAACRLP